MVKKIIHITLALTLLVVTMGFTVSKHYCGDNLVSISVNHEAKSCCDMDGCCHNETNHYQLEEDFVYSLVTTDIQIQSIDVLFPIVFAILQIEPEIVNNEVYTYSKYLRPYKIQTILSLYQTYLC